MYSRGKRYFDSVECLSGVRQHKLGKVLLNRFETFIIGRWQHVDIAMESSSNVGNC